jgi:hypothetical protein
MRLSSRERSQQPYFLEYTSDRATVNAKTNLAGYNRAKSYRRRGRLTIEHADDIKRGHPELVVRMIKELSELTGETYMKPKTVTLVLSLLLLDWTFSLSSGHSQDKVRLGYSGLGSGEEIHHLAKDLGLFRKHNVEGETIRITVGATIVQSIVSGELHFARGSANEVVSAHLGGFQLKILSGVN